ncbi:hypothetical protein, partial [Streptomyces sp. NPDC056632]|uniref:hypothetical protein n=1 Tax=Streptomyces sp. NPDC056632 TaxID=3345884 RepID=UPI00369ED230
ARRGDTDMALQLKEAFDAKADARRLQLTHPDPDPITEPKAAAPGENVLQQTRDGQTPETPDTTAPPTPDQIHDQLFAPQHPEAPDPLDTVLDAAAKEHDLLPSQLRQQLDDLVTEAKSLNSRAVELDYLLDPTRTDALSQAVTDARNTGRLTDAQTTLGELRDLVTAADRQAVRDPLDDVIGEAARERGLDPVELRRRLDDAVVEVQGLESRALRHVAHLSPEVTEAVEELFMAVVNARPAGRLDEAEEALVQLRAIVDLAERTALREPLDPHIDTAAKELGMPPAQLRQQLDDLVTEATTLRNRAVELDHLLDTTRTDALSQTVTDARRTGRLTDARTALDELRDIVTAAEEASRTRYPQSDQPVTPDPDLRDSEQMAGGQLKPVLPVNEPQQSIADILGGIKPQTPQESTAAVTPSVGQTLHTDTDTDTAEPQDTAPDTAPDTDADTAPDTVPGEVVAASRDSLLGRSVESIVLPDPDELQALLVEPGRTTDD